MVTKLVKAKDTMAKMALKVGKVSKQSGAAQMVSNHRFTGKVVKQLKVSQVKSSAKKIQLRMAKYKKAPKA